MNEDVAIKVDRIYKDFLLPHEKHQSLKTTFTNIFRGNRGSSERQHALKDISFEVKKGEFFGIVGRNGSGKSTLLKILARIYQPTSGSVEIVGRLIPFIELGVGFNPELTGRENVYLSAALMGFSKNEVNAMYKDIVEFAELENFMDQKLKNYSSGMQVRLAFSIATRSQGDILLIDEVLAVGDADFQRKCFNYFKKLKKENKTVVFVSHDMEAVREYCDRALLIQDSKIIEIGETAKVAEEYVRLFNTNLVERSTQESADMRWGSFELKTSKITTQITDKTIKFNHTFIASSQVSNYVVGFRLRDSSGTHILGTNTKLERLNTETITKGSQATIEWVFPNVLSDGTYFIDTAIQETNGVAVIEWWDEAVTLKIRKDRHVPYGVDLDYSVSLK